MKVSGGQVVKAGTVLTRQGDKWHPGINIIGKTLLTAACSGEVYFTRRKNTYRKVTTYINIRSKASKTEQAASSKK